MAGEQLSKELMLLYEPECMRAQGANRILGCPALLRETPPPPPRGPAPRPGAVRAGVRDHPSRPEVALRGGFRFLGERKEEEEPLEEAEEEGAAPRGGHGVGQGVVRAFGAHIGRGGLGGDAARGLRARAPVAAPPRVPAAQRRGGAAGGGQRAAAAPRIPLHGLGQPRLPGLPVPGAGDGEGAGNGRRHPSDRRARPHHQRRTGCQEGVEEPPKKRAVEKSKDSNDTRKDVRTTKAETTKERESILPKKQEKVISKDPEGSQSTCSSNQGMVTESAMETEGKSSNAENTTEQNLSSSEKESREKPCSNPPKESKRENVPSPEKKTTVSVVPPAAKSSLEAVAAAVPPAAKSSLQAEAVAAAVPPAAKSSPQVETVAAAVPPAAKSSLQAETVAAAVPPAAKSTTGAVAAAAVPPTTKSTLQAAAVAAVVPPTTKSTPQAATVAAAAKSTPQTSATLLSSKNQVSTPAPVSKSGAQAGTSLLLAPKAGVAQVGASLLLAPKSSAQAGTSLLLASKGAAKVGSSLLASKSSAEVAASLLAARSGAQQGSSLLTSKSSAQVAASLLAARSGAQQGPSSLASRSGAQAGASLLASKGGTQAGSPQLASKSGSQAAESPAKALCKPLTSEDAKERQPFFNRLYKAVAWKLVAVGGFSPNVNHAELLNSSIQSVKATLDVAFVPLKELADLPQNKSSLENIVCELRCKSVYLGTGCGKSMENAKAVASREALKLFLKKKVIVKICKRKYKGREIEDLVLLDEESKPSNLPPALRNPREIL